MMAYILGFDVALAIKSAFLPLWFNVMSNATALVQFDWS